MNRNQKDNKNQNFNDEKERKVVESEKHSVIPTLLVCAAVVGVFLLTSRMGFMPLHRIALAGVAAMIASRVGKKKFPPQKVLNYETADDGEKIIEVEKKSATPIISVGITWVIVIAFFGRMGIFSIAVAAIASYVVYNITKRKFPPEKVQIHIEDETDKSNDKTEAVTVDSELKELIDKIDVYLIEIKLLNDSIDDAAVSNELLAIESIMSKIQAQLKDETKATKRISQVDQFFEYYMPTVVKILNSYRRIETHELTGDNATETKKRVSEALPFIKRAFEKELDYMFTDEMLDITTDIDVLESMLSKDGLIDKHNITTP